MSTFSRFLTAAILVLAAGCGSSTTPLTSTATHTTTNTAQTTTPSTSTATNTTTNTAQTTNSATNTATSTVTNTKTATATSTLTNTATPTTTNTATATGDCNYPSCLTNVLTTCVPSGTCVEQSDTTTLATNTCYANGVKQLTTINAIAGSAMVTVKNGSATCYSMEIGGITATAASYDLTIKNSSGQIVATGTVDSADSTMTVACTGGQPVTVDSNCDPTGSNASSATCTTGTCAGDSSTGTTTGTSTATATLTSTKTSTATATATGANCAALSVCCPSLVAASGMTVQQCQAALVGAPDTTCASTLASVRAAGLCP